jgi:hypothetical protein
MEVSIGEEAECARTVQRHSLCSPAYDVTTAEEAVVACADC